jgi:serine/threonine-protein kinase
VVDSTPRILGGRYEVGELIGRGGMAEVHIGHDTRLGRTVAIKILRSDLARDPSFQARFRREAQAAASLNHPAIVAVYDTGEDVAVEHTGAVAHVPFIVMEYVEGHTVRDILGDGAAVPIEEAVEITAGVLSALEYSHHAGIVHRDIKPANVMLTPTGAVKVMDFGIARAMADAAGTMTQTQAVIGTAQYLSPEQARGEAVDSRSDLYSTGCLLFELLTGRPPFVGDSPVAVAYQHARETAQPPSMFASDVPNSLDRITMKALAKDREYRYGSAAEFRTDLEVAQRGGPISAPPIGVIGAAAVGAAAFGAVGAAAAGRHADPAGATQVMGAAPPPTQVAPAAPAGWAPLGGNGLDDDGFGAEDEAPRRPWIMWVLIGVAAAAIIGIILLLTNRPPPPGPEKVEVPDVIGMTADDARDEIEDAGLEFQQELQPNDAPKDEVFETDPEAGEEVDAGSVVTVFVSSGPDSIEMPDLTGRTQAEARNELVQRGFDAAKITTTTEHSPDIPLDSVTKTEPPPGDLVPKDSEITLYLSDGQVELPDLVGKTEAEAREIILTLLLTAGYTYEDSDGPPGIVLSQSRGPGPVEQRASIDIVISRERTTTTVPDVRGMTCDEAKTALGNASLNASPTCIEETAGGGGAPGTAHRTDPGRNSIVAEGTEVTIYIHPLVPGP